jgi:hypothetical protein
VGASLAEETEKSVLVVAIPTLVRFTASMSSSGAEVHHLTAGDEMRDALINAAAHSRGYFAHDATKSWMHD